jgi:hypothetical protein
MFIRRYGDSTYANLARARLEELIGVTRSADEKHVAPHKRVIAREKDENEIARARRRQEPATAESATPNSKTSIGVGF